MLTIKNLFKWYIVYAILVIGFTSVPSTASYEETSMYREVMDERLKADTLAQHLASTYKVSKEEVLRYYRIASDLTKDGGFPSRSYVLAVMCVESSLQKKAVGEGGMGLMQINPSVFQLNDYFDPEENISEGVSLLKNYFSSLGDVKATFLAYNAGIGNYLRGNFNSEYWVKVRKAKEDIDSVYDQ